MNFNISGAAVYFRIPTGIPVLGDFLISETLVVSWIVMIDDGRVAISAVAVGMAQGVLERAAKYSKERVTFGKPICENQAIAFKLAEMATEIDVARAMLYNTARMSDNGLPFSKEATMTKMFCSEMCVRVCDMGLQIMGGYGLCDEYQAGGQRCKG